MPHKTKSVLKSSLLACLLASAFALSALPAAAQDGAAAKEKDDPPFGDYKGVRIGMTADEARKKLGAPTDKGDSQDFYAVNDNETVQVFYDAEKKVHALSIIYLGGGAASAPAAKAVLGVDVEAKPDGSMHRRVDNPKAGFWVAYSRTAGDSPLVTITMQKK
jgi:hypothetical protein